MFKTRLEERYDLEDDVLYNTWAKLSTKAIRQPLTEITNTKSTEKSTVQELLQVPQAIQQKEKSGTRGTTNIPKHLSGQEMIQL